MPQESDEGICFYLGRSPDVANIKEKSAEVIVIGSHEPMERSEDSQTNEGPNVKLIEMLQGGLNFEFTSLALNVDQSCDRCKERL